MVAAIRETIAALRAAGRLERVDSSRIQAALGLGEQVDLAPGNPQLWRECRMAVETLLNADVVAEGDFDKLLKQLTKNDSGAKVGDKPKP